MWLWHLHRGISTRGAFIVFYDDVILNPNISHIHVHTTQNSVQRNGRDAEIEDLRSRLEAAHEHVAKQNDTIVQMTFDYEALQIQIEEVNSQEIVKDLEGKVEHYQIQVSICITFLYLSSIVYTLLLEKS